MIKITMYNIQKYNKNELNRKRMLSNERMYAVIVDLYSWTTKGIYLGIKCKLNSSDQNYILFTQFI